jgi:mono/diheme cytochrome c family protein
MKKIILSIAIISLISSCYYDNEEVLYPNNGNCDTTNVTYTNTIQPIMSQSCTGCHGSSSPSGGIDLTTYSLVRASAEDGSLLGTMAFQSGYSPMPKGGNKVSDCTLNKIQAWINKGYPN